MLISHWDRRSV